MLIDSIKNCESEIRNVAETGSKEHDLMDDNLVYWRKLASIISNTRGQLRGTDLSTFDQVFIDFNIRLASIREELYYSDKAPGLGQMVL